jgi:aryl-alcohol dehydrogenase-like predicted oxidoreductase
MEHRRLGRSGVKVSRFGLGTMVLGAWGNTDLAACRRIIHGALDAGVNLVDTADVYGNGENESIVGAALAGRRDDVVLGTKFHHPVGGDTDPNRRGNSRRWIMTAVDDSLRRLGTDHIDLYQVHRPDPDTAIEETVEALTDLVRAGKIRTWGTSTFPAEQIVGAHWAAARRGAIGPHSEQPPYSIMCRGVERDVLPTCAEHGMGVITWSPLSGGWLTGQYTRETPAPAGSRADTNADHFDGGNEAKFDAVTALGKIADQAGLRMPHLALAWVVEHPAVTAALIGPRTEEQLKDLLEASELRLDEDLLDAIDEVVAPGVTLNQADVGWDPPGLAPTARRRRRP